MTKITLTRPLKTALLVLAGAFVGAGFLFLYMLRFTTYLGDDPSACVNCHIMQPYYATWDHSSHKNVTTCNECHVPHENVARKYAFKGVDGMKHTAAFLSFSEPQVPAAKDPSAQVIMNNCIRCHTELTTEMVKLGKMDFKMTQEGEGKACWDCHTAGRTACPPPSMPRSLSLPLLFPNGSRRLSATNLPTDIFTENK